MSADTEVILYDNVPSYEVVIAADDLIPVELVWFDVLPAELAEVLRGPPGPPGGGVSNVMEYVADGALGGHRIVRATTAGKVGYVDPSDPDQAHAALGLTTGAVADGALASVQFAGPITEPSWSWTPNLPVFVGAAGVPTQTPPSSGFHATVGVAVSATSMVIQLKSPIVL